MSEPTSYQKAMLGALQSRPMYEGTVPEKVKLSRRAKNKLARKARRG